VLIEAMIDFVLAPMVQNRPEVEKKVFEIVAMTDLTVLVRIAVLEPLELSEPLECLVECQFASFVGRLHNQALST